MSRIEANGKQRISQILVLSSCALVAFILAYSLGLPNPYWASMPIWVIPGTSREELLLKGFYRIMGTIIGGILALLIVSLPIQLLFKILLVTFFIAFFTATAKTQKALYGYANLLSAITLAIVALPSFVNENPWHVMISRLYCTFIGVMMAVVFLIINSQRTYNHQSHLPRFNWNRFKDKVSSSVFKTTFIFVFLATLFALSLILWGINHHLNTDSELMAFGMIVFAVVLSVDQSPKKQSRYVFTGAVLGSIVALLYRYFIHQHLSSLAVLDISFSLYLSLIPFMFLAAFIKTGHLEKKGAIDAILCFLLIGKPGNFEIELPIYLGHLKFLLMGALFITLVFQFKIIDQFFKRDSERCL